MTTLWSRLPRPLRWWLAIVWSARRLWRWGLLVAAVLAVLVTVFRAPLAEWMWPDSRIQQLLEEGEAALASGNLSAADGSGARELFQAALALDSDRADVNRALVRTGEAALARAREALEQREPGRARQALALAAELQVPSQEVAKLSARLRTLEADPGGVELLLLRAQGAHHAGHLDGADDAALPLYRQVLAQQPDRLQALEGREDALSELLAGGRQKLAQGDLAGAAGVLRRVQQYDPGHIELPDARAAFNEALDQRRQRASQDLARGRLARAGETFAGILAAVPEDEAARRGLERTVARHLDEAQRLAADFQFEAARKALDAARTLQPDAPQLEATERALERARQSQRSLESPQSGAQRERRLRQLLARFEAAEAKGDWLLPPGNSAFDALREAQALAPVDPRVRRALQRLLPAARRCFEQHLPQNRVRAAGACLDAWQALAPTDGGLPGARRRLAQHWIAVGSERLRAGDATFAREALQQARALDPATPEIAGFAERLRDVVVTRDR